MDDTKMANDGCGERSWRDHVLAAERFLGSNRKYCEAHGLTLGTFYTQKRKLGFAKSVKKPKFVQVESAPILSKNEMNHEWPPARWAAEFLFHYRNLK